MIVTSFRRIYEPAGIAHDVSWSKLVERLGRPLPCPRDVDNPDLPAWAPAVFRGHYRDKGRVLAVHAVTLDFDKLVPSVERIAKAFDGSRFVLHSTRRYHPDLPRLRVVRATTRAMTPEEYPVTWEVEAERLARVGLTVDGSTKDASRAWFVPSRPRAGAYVFAAHDGDPLDVDALLTKAAHERAARLRESRRAYVAPMGTRYAQGALRRECGELATTAAGARNHRLNRAAFSLARFVASGELAEHEVTSELAHAAHVAGLRGAEVARTIASGLRAGLENDR